MNSRPLHHTFAPMADGRQVLLACGLLLAPWQHGSRSATERLRAGLSDHLNGDAFLFASGRQSLFALLTAAGIGKEDEVVVQAYTCIVVPNAIQATGAVPVYAEIDPDTLSIDMDQLAMVITPKTKAIICQHTFGIPAPLSELRAFCDERGLLLIEDCAHIHPDDRGPHGIGTTGDAAFFSFGRDKAISGVSGGAVVCKKADVSRRLQAMEREAGPLPGMTVFRFLLYPILYAIAKPLYGLGIGKVFLAVCGRIGLLVPIVTKTEKKGKQERLVHRIPEACAALVLDQWKRLGTLNDHRRALTAFYLHEGNERFWSIPAGVCEGVPLQKFPLFVQNAEQVRRTLKKQNIHLHDGWTGCVICPGDADAACAGYREGSDPAAETSSQQILSLPTHPTMSMEEAKRLVNALDPLLRRT